MAAARLIAFEEAVIRDRPVRVGCGAGALCEPFPDPWWPDVPDGPDIGGRNATGDMRP